MLATKQGQYLWIKQRLDKYNISTNFPLEMMPLLQALLNRIDGEVAKTNNMSYEQLKNSILTVKQLQLTNKLIPDALKLQISRVTQQNNQLHMDVITLKQELQSLKHYMDKLAIERSDNKTQISRIIAFKNDKQQEIREQLQQIKFKYNQLMDFIHNNDSLEKMYLKRLLNHKHFQIKEEDNFRQQSQTGKVKYNERKSDSRQDLNSRITFNAKNSSSRQKQTRTRINQTLQQGSHNQSQIRNLGNDQVKKLKQKLFNREKQIQRLQSISTLNGPNLNKVLTQFNHSMQTKKHSQINQRLQFLQTQNQQLIKDFKNAKNNAGRYQALRDQVDKSHQIIKTLKQQNKNIKRSLKQNNFNSQKDRKQNQRSIGIFNTKNSQMKLSKFNDELKIQQLKKKVQFYEKELGVIIKQKEILNKNENKKKINDSQKKAKKKSVKGKKIVEKDPQRATYQNHIKFNINKSEIKQKSNKKPKKLAQNESKDKKQEMISKIPNIPQQSQQQSIQQSEQQINSSSQNQKPFKPHQSYQIKHISDNKKKKVSSKSESQQSSSDQEQENGKDQTLAEQYLETINELTAKCLQLKQQLENKNNAIQGLQEIINRLMEKQKQNLNQSQSQSQIQEKQQKIQNNLNQQQQNKKEISKLKNQVQSLSSLLNQSQFQKQQLRRQFIEIQKLYKQIPSSSMSQQNTLKVTISNLAAKIVELQQIIRQKDSKIQDMREDNSKIQDKLLKSLDMVRRLNDQIETINNERQGLMKEFQLKSLRLDQAFQQLRKQKQKHQTTIQLSEIQKDQIIQLRKNLLNAQNKINELQNYIYQMQNNQQQDYADDYN